MNKLQHISAPVGRLFLALIFVMSGLNKIGQYEGTQGYMEAMGVSGALLPLVIATEVLGGMAIILGWKVRYAAIALGGFSALSAIMFHADFSNPAEMANFMKNFALAGAFLLIFTQGGGAYALDNRSK